MKVLITVPCLELPGGVANYYRTLRPYLSRDHAYFEIGSRPGEAGVIAVLTRLIRDYVRFLGELRKTQYDLVHINPSLGPFSVVRDGILLLIAKAYRQRILVFFRGWDPACEITIRARYERIFRFVYGGADAIVVLAEEFRSALREIGIRAPILIETTLVEDEFLLPTTKGESSVGAGSHSCRILYLGRLDRGKGIIEAIAAFEQLRGSNVVLTIAGDGPERLAAEAMVQSRRIDGVTFVGHLDGAERREAFQNADIYVFTSLAEGMPNSVLEAMAFGLPIVTRPVGGLRDFFEDGCMGYATESHDPEDIAELLGRLVGNPSLRATMGQYNREYARKRFAASVVAARLLGIYEQVVGQSASD